MSDARTCRTAETAERLIDPTRNVQLPNQAELARGNLYLYQRGAIVASKQATLYPGCLSHLFDLTHL